MPCQGVPLEACYHTMPTTRVIRDPITKVGGNVGDFRYLFNSVVVACDLGLCTALVSLYIHSFGGPST